MSLPLVRDGSCIDGHDLFYGQDSGTFAQKTACAEAANFPQILGKFETIGSVFDFLRMPPIVLTLQ